MSGKVRRIDFSPDEYVSGVGGVLNAAEQGVYWMICALVMSEGAAVAMNERRIAGLCLIRPAEARRIIEKLVAIGKLSRTDDGKLYQKRALSEVEASSNRIRTAIENGSKGGRPKKIAEQNQQVDEPDGYSAAKLTINYQPPTTSEEEKVIRTKPAKRRHSYTADFSAFWEGYPTDALMSKAKAGAAFQALEPDDQELAIKSIPAFRAYCAAHADYRPVHAVRYLTERRFDGFVKTVQTNENRVFVRLGSPTWQAIMAKRGVVSMPHTENDGQRGWWFSKDEAAAAERSGAPVNWQTAGATH